MVHSKVKGCDVGEDQWKTYRSSNTGHVSNQILLNSSIGQSLDDDTYTVGFMTSHVITILLT